jgi:hypothetical protein
MAMSYPFFGNPLASMSLPLTSAPSAADSITIEKKKPARKPTVIDCCLFCYLEKWFDWLLVQEKQLGDSASIQVLRLPETSAANQTSSGSNGKARSQTVNGKPLALDVSSLIGKPSASSSSSLATNPDEVPLNLSMKTKEDAANAAANVAASTVMVDSLATASSCPSPSCAEDWSLQKSLSPVKAVAEPTETSASTVISSSSSSLDALLDPALTQARPTSRVMPPFFFTCCLLCSH